MCMKDCWWFPSTSKIYWKKCVGFFNIKTKTQQFFWMGFKSWELSSLNRESQRWQKQNVEILLKVHFKFPVPFTYCACKMELRASLIYTAVQNLQLLLPEKLQYFDIYFVLKQGMKIVEFCTKKKRRHFLKPSI